MEYSAIADVIVAHECYRYFQIRFYNLFLMLTFMHINKNRNVNFDFL